MIAPRGCRLVVPLLRGPQRGLPRVLRSCRQGFGLQRPAEDGDRKSAIWRGFCKGLFRTRTGDPLLTMRSDPQLDATDGNGFGLVSPLLRESDLRPIATGCNHGAPQGLHRSLSKLATAARSRLRLQRVAAGRFRVASTRCLSAPTQALRGRFHAREITACRRSRRSSFWRMRPT
jgi:hypothetical protein